MMLVDTDVLIWNLRGNLKAATLLDETGYFSLSAVTYMELVQGVRDSAELNSLRKALRYWHATVQPINEEISARAMFLVESFALSHGLQMADALIAATGLFLGVPVVTANDKHYAAVDGLDIKVFRP